jgi:hypothetical protein
MVGELQRQIRRNRQIVLRCKILVWADAPSSRQRPANDPLTELDLAAAWKVAGLSDSG